VLATKTGWKIVLIEHRRALVGFHAGRQAVSD
jgi:hypothetical protein